MGHERLGTLPKTQRWQQVIEQIAKPSMTDADISDIARRTTQNIGSRLRNIQGDSGVQAAFKFLVTLSVASRSQNPQEVLYANGVKIPAAPTPLSITKAVHTQVMARTGSLEYGQIAQNAVADAVAAWHERNRDTQLSLFESPHDPFRTWKRAGTGSGFCELARLFFANFTERYLNYFLEREASAHIRDFREREQFHKKIQDHIDDISKHAFETSKIAQSFAAGWFNKHAAVGVPSDSEIEDFLFIAFGKIREELQRESDNR